jgi:hypothetical protein
MFVAVKPFLPSLIFTCKAEEKIEKTLQLICIFVSEEKDFFDINAYLDKFNLKFGVLYFLNCLFYTH